MDEIIGRIDEMHDELDDLKAMLQNPSVQPPLKRVKDTRDFLCVECRKDGIDHPHCMMNMVYKGRTGVCAKGHCIIEEEREARLTGKQVEPYIPKKPEKEKPKKRKAYRLDRSGFDVKAYVRAIERKRKPVHICSMSEAKCGALIGGQWIYFRRISHLACFLERHLNVISPALKRGEYRTIQLKRVNQ